jgi:hypothetical protein
MMPTFPPPPRSFRTSGFPQYGWKAGSQAMPSHPVLRLSLLPAYPSRPVVCLRPSCSPYPVIFALALCREVPAPSHTAVQAVSRSTPGALAPAWFCCPDPLRLSAPSAPLAGTARFHRLAAYTPCLRCAGAPRRPASGSMLSPSVPSQHVALIDPGEPVGCIYPVPSPTTQAFAPYSQARHSRVTHNPLPVGARFRGCPGSHRCDLLSCSPPLADPTRLSPGRPRLVHSGFQRVGHPPRRRV